MKAFHHTAAAILLCTALLAGAAPAAAQDGDDARHEPIVTVTLRAEADSAGPFVRVGEIAEVRCDDPSTAELARGVYLGRAPGTGDARRIAYDRVRSRLHQEGISSDRVLMEGAVICTVRRTTDPATARLIGRLERAAADAVTDTVRRDRPDARVEIADGAADLDLSAVPSDADAEVVERGASAPDDDGTARVLLRVRIPGDERLREVTGTVACRVLVPEVITTRTVRRGARVQPGDLEVRWVDVTDSDENDRRADRRGIADADDAIGLAWERSLGPERPVRRDDLRRPVLVHRGDRVSVRVIARDGDRVVAVLRMSGEAREDGALGDQVEVELTHRRRVVLEVADVGLVTSPGGRDALEAWTDRREDR